MTENLGNVDVITQYAANVLLERARALESIVQAYLLMGVQPHELVIVEQELGAGTTKFWVEIRQGE